MKHKIHPKKLLNSKWTAISPINKQKHFLVSELEFDEDNVVVYCELQAIINEEIFSINWRNLQDASKWLQGWKERYI